jgi:hypothetical protein
MPPGAYRDRVIPPAEVRAILRRALRRAELEEAARAPGESAGRGHTLEEVTQIAGDAGISEAALREALAGESEPTPASAEPLSLAGAPARVSLARTVRGRPEGVDREKLARAMRDATGDLGEAKVAGDTWSWSSSRAGPRSVFAVVEPAGEGRVAIRIDDDLRARQRWTFVGVGGIGGTLGLAVIAPFIGMLSHGLAPFALCAWWVFIYLLARETYVQRFRAREAELRKLLGEMAVLVETTGARVAPGLAREEMRGARVAEAREVELLGDEEANEAKGSGRAQREG